MSKTDRLTITENIGTIQDGMTGTELQELLNQATVQGFIGVRVSVTHGYSSYHDHTYDDDYYELVVQRLETDEEYKQRLDKVKRALEAKKKRQEAQKLKRKSAADQKKEADRKLYEQLKKQFESES